MPSMCRFNSILVRLKVHNPLSEPDTPYETLFQFHTGSIKSVKSYSS